MNKEQMKRILQDEQDVKPVGSHNGTAIYDFDGYIKKVQAEKLSPTPDTGERTFDNEGKVARSRTLFSAINEADIYANRFKKKKTAGAGSDEIWVVLAAVDSVSGLAVREKNYQPRVVPVYVFKRDLKSEKLYLDRKTTVSGADFISDFTDTLKKDVVKELLQLVATADDDTTAVDIPI